ncbi:hypothetical protein GWI33_013871, partial [Rhynchophorus ferrugineus]
DLCPRDAVLKLPMSPGCQMRFHRRLNRGKNTTAKKHESEPDLYEKSTRNYLK